MDFSDKTVGPFQVKWEIGRGGTATVYRATDMRSQQDVALKILPPTIATDPMFLKRFIKEGKNEIEIRVVTTIGNYLKSLTDNRVAQYWTNEGRTIQPLQPMGLVGPVTMY